jgi:hypothetical protein
MSGLAEIVSSLSLELFHMSRLVFIIPRQGQGHMQEEKQGSF